MKSVNFRGFCVLNVHGIFHTAEQCSKMSGSDVWQAVFAVIKGTQGKSRLSAYDIQQAIMRWFTDKKIWPMGLSAAIPCCQDWALKQGNALKKLAPVLHLTQQLMCAFLLRRSFA